ncbi:MAG: phosphate ABC transporter permease PstA [Metamycoplasmataceae bacterium]
MAFLNETIFEKKKRNNSVFKTISIIASLFMGVVFFGLIITILLQSIKGFQEFGFKNILFTTNFNSTEKSFWIPFTVTILSSAIALLIAVPLGIRIAIFAKYRLNKKWSNRVILFFQTLSGIPSVIFGLFAVNSLGFMLNLMFGISKNSIFNSAIMLAFMVLPSIISLTTESLNSIDKNIYNNALALGSSQTISIYKICKKAARQGIIVAVIISLSRAIGESMAVSMILQSQPSSELFNNDFFSILNSSGQSLGAYISTAMFADSDPEKIRPLLYAFGFIMLIISMLLNLIVTTLIYRRKSGEKIQRITVKVIYFICFVPYLLRERIEYAAFNSEYKLDKDELSNTFSYIKDRKQNYKMRDFYSWYKKFWEYFAIVMGLLFLTWITFDIIINGFLAINSSPDTFTNFGKNSIAQSLLNTFLIIVVTLIIGFPISLLIAIYLNEYAKNKKLKITITFFLDSLGSTPSILFGIFGLLFFIQTLGWTYTGRTGNSLIAGALTLIIVVVPSFTRLLERNLKSIPDEVRINAYALGSSKFETIRKLILPPAINSMSASIVSTIGRILSETAPLYLTAGLSSSVQTSLLTPGTTLTTNIYSQIFSTNPNATNVQFQAALVTLVFVFFLIIIAYLIIPNWGILMEKIHYIKDYIKSKVKKEPKNA